LTPDSQPGFLDAVAALQQAVTELSTPAMIIGGVAVSALGVPRLTADIDATVAAGRIDIDQLIEVLGRQGIRPRISDAAAFAHAKQVVLAVHQASGTPIDLILAWLPFELEALDNSEERDFAGVRIRVPRPEDLLIYKLAASRPRDLQDAEQLLALYGTALDLRRVRETVRQFAEALEDDERLRALDRMLRDAGLKD
jgi:hypothetical protein